MLPIDTIIQGDCLEVMQQIDNKIIDMILCDLPYGTTHHKWDIQIYCEIARKRVSAVPERLDRWASFEAKSEETCQ